MCGTKTCEKCRFLIRKGTKKRQIQVNRDIIRVS